MIAFLGNITALVVSLVFLVFLLYGLREKRIQKKVLSSSYPIKKIKELNQVFPTWSIDYNHHIVERIEYRTKRSVKNFNPDKALKQRKDELKSLVERRLDQQSYYQQYRSLFEKTCEANVTPLSVIQENKISKRKYRKTEKNLLKSLFERKPDNEEITYTVYAHHKSLRKKNELTSEKRTYQEKNFNLTYLSKLLDVDYSICRSEPIEEEKKETTEEKKEETDKSLLNHPEVQPVTLEKKIPEEKKEETAEALPKREEENILEAEVDHIFYILKENRAIVKKAEKGVTDLMIPSSIQFEDRTYYVTSIQEKAFFQNHDIKTLFIEEGLMEIGPSAFQNCVHLESVQFPSTLLTLGKKAFCGCIQLKKAVLNDSIRIIGEEAFSLCTALEDLYLPSTAVKVGASLLWYSGQAKIHITQGKEISHFDPEWNVDDNPIVL